MPEIIIKTALDNSEIAKGGQDAARKVTTALEAAAPKAKEAGKKIGNALDAGIKEGLRNAPQLTQQIQNIEKATGRLTAAFGALAAIGVASIFKQVAETAVQAAINIDRQVNTLKALTGSAEAAKRRFQELVDLAQKTPGLTSNLALALDTQLRILNVTEQTINRVLPALGRLNAISPINPQQFAGNLVQLITQGFERQDLKELVGNSPFAGDLIKQIFNVDSPTNAKAIRESAKKLGIRTVEDFFTAFAKAAENNPRLQAVTESLGTQFDKLQDRLNLALAPLGEQITKVLLPVFDDLVKSVEKYGGTAAKVFVDNKNDIIAAAKEITAMAVEVGKLTAKIVELASKSGVFKIIAINLADAADIFSGDVSVLDFFSGVRGPRVRALEAQLKAQEEERVNQN
jgi:seryl-tRNA synthetase